MATKRQVIANLDFDEIKSDIINHFKSREEFSDYEFTGSSLNLLMDILSYNTHYYSLASNFLLNESFLDSATIRKNVVSLAKQLNYTPRSITSASSTVVLNVDKPSDANYRIIPAGTLFNATAGNQTKTFYTTEDYVVQFGSGDTSKQTEITIYEGKFKTQLFSASKSYEDFAVFDLGDDSVDTSTITVSVNGEQYYKVTPENETIFSLNSESMCYFIEENRNGNTNVIFGNGVAGKTIDYGDQIVVSYLKSTGEDGNGISKFSSSSTYWSIYSSSIAQGGGSKEDLQSIKDNAPKWFQSQYRAVTTNDYESILRNKYADIQAISVYGGEDVGYPGKVFICIKPKSADVLTDSIKAVIKSDILSNYNVITVKPEIVDPQIFKLILTTAVIYDKTRLTSSRSVLKSSISTLFEDINTTYIGDFLANFHESNLSYKIKDLDKSVISSNTRVKIAATVTAVDQQLDQYTFNFNNRLYHPSSGFKSDTGGILSSDLFYRVGRDYQSGFDEDGYGNIRLYDFIDGVKVYVNNSAGTIDYDNGTVQLLIDFDPQDTTFDLIVIPDSVDIIAVQDMILEIDTEKSTVEAIEIDETDLLSAINLNRSF